MIAEASDEKLQEALQSHLEETKEQLNRLEQLSTEFDFKIEGHNCKGIKGIIAEGEESLKEITDPATKDAAIIASAQRVEHYEIAAYGTARALADQMDHDDASDILSTTLDEESAADEKLTGIAEGGWFEAGVNEEANDMKE
jgi:ferritin-like metal-binding protein YciE